MENGSFRLPPPLAGQAAQGKNDKGLIVNRYLLTGFEIHEVLNSISSFAGP
jgi:hypothetical protein